MQASILLAKIFSIYFVVIGLSMLCCVDSFRSRAHAYMNNEGVMLLGGIITLLLGILLILMHSIWVYDWRLLVTILAWLTFVKGIIHVSCPHIAKRMMQNVDSQLAYRISALVCLIIAVYLGYHGFGF
jgi:hypothetical protein